MMTYAIAIHPNASTVTYLKVPHFLKEASFDKLSGLLTNVPTNDIRY
jgi:hypothetical protein